VAVLSERVCLRIARGKNQWVFGELDLHNVLSSQTHREKVLILPVTRVVEQHPTNFLHPSSQSVASRYSLNCMDELQCDRSMEAGLPAHAVTLSMRESGKGKSGNPAPRRRGGDRLLSARDDHGIYALIKLFMRMSPRHWTRGKKIP
jgi:hypothetical protein